jgi:hypothetical protein
MNIRQLRDLAIKFIGLWCLSGGVIILSQVVSMLGYSFWAGSFLTGLVYLLSFLVAVLLYGGLAYMLLFRTHAVAGVLWRGEEMEATGEPNVAFTLEICVALIGLYLVPDVLQRVTGELLTLAARPENMSVQPLYTGLIADAVKAVVAVLCIVKSKAIAAYIRKYAE